MIDKSKAPSAVSSLAAELQGAIDKFRRWASERLQAYAVT
jgi:hypothetical protein